MRKVSFVKYHGLENDFLVVGLAPLRLPAQLRADLARRLCSRNCGVGADGVLFYSRHRGRFRMLLYNSDGSQAEISGNGLRILAQYLRDQGLVRRRRFEIDTATAGNQIELISRSGCEQMTAITLARPRFRLSEIPMRGESTHFVNRPFKVPSGELSGTAVNVGNPHIVFFVDNFDFDWRGFGKEVESDPRFPERTNVEFARLKSRHSLIHRSWERGAGETRASGTGAAAAVAAGVINGLLGRQVTVQEPAGRLKLELASLDDPIRLIGPSVRIAAGVFYYDPNG